MERLNLNNRFACLIRLFSLTCITCAAVSCSSDADGELDAQPERIAIHLSANIAKDNLSRSYWTEDQVASCNASLLFHWEDEATGQMKAVVTGNGVIKPFEGGKFYSDIDVMSTSDRLLANLKMKNTLMPDATCEAGDSIYIFSPIHGQDSKVSYQGADRVEYSFSIPDTLIQSVPNSATHLSPYIYMAGKSALKMEAGAMSTQISANVLPVAVRFNLVNAEQYALEVNDVGISGRLANSGSLTITPEGHKLIYLEEDNNYAGVRSDMKIDKEHTVNLYAMLLPTRFEEGEQVMFNLKGKYSNGWTAIFENIAIDCKSFCNNVLEPNSCYYVTLEVAHDYLYVVINGVVVKAFQCGNSGGDIELNPESSI